MNASTRVAISSSIWILCGIIVIVARNIISQNVNLLTWEVIGGLMIAYGLFKIGWYFATRERANAASSSED